MLLLEDLLVLLQRVDDKLVLKCQSTNQQAIGNDYKYTHSPVLKLQNLLARNVATGRAQIIVVGHDMGSEIRGTAVLITVTTSTHTTPSSNCKSCWDGQYCSVGGGHMGGPGGLACKGKGDGQYCSVGGVIRVALEAWLARVRGTVSIVV